MTCNQLHMLQENRVFVLKLSNTSELEPSSNWSTPSTLWYK